MLLYLGLGPRNYRRRPVAVSQRGRWEFLFVVAPLQIGGGTGSPVNPVAVL